ncbi:Protein of unknown function [Geodermatophilus amargosae]|uniref:Uncharacterized protein n=1 Tax=Geodermatophilus amargosae TaxID=1296565 RepID=A0A1I7CGC6_9ACTN|nr:DUF3892 domain-containing protein [Geodermatophilus amargosae]SFT98505.1 Protein of unknown function [Geodermatophilus amargosae]
MTTLLVPVTLDVLVVRPGDDDTWAETRSPDPAPEPGKRLRQSLAPEPFTDLTKGRKPGAYVQWLLPDGLGHGERDGDRVRFRPLPNRWLLVRLSGPTTPGPRAVHAWLLPDTSTEQPARLDDALVATTLPPAGVPLEDPLSAAGPGDPAWSSYFDNVQGRFALHDDLAGVTGPVAYLVCGWYVDPAADPLHGATGVDFWMRMDALGWDVDRDRPMPTVPDQVLLHGAAVAIGWPEQRWPGGGDLGLEDELRPSADTVELGIGETTTEAVTALLGDGGTAGRMVEGFLAGLLGELGAPDGPARVDAELHARRFSSVASESGTEAIWDPATPTAVNPGTGGFRTVARPGPRSFQAVDPTLVVRGGGRSLRFGGDGRFDPLDRLRCRVDGDQVSSFGPAGGDPGAGAAVLPVDVFATLRPLAGLPTACDALLVELAALDPGSAPDLAAAALSPVADIRSRWWGSWDVAADPDLMAGATVVGLLPSPVAVAPPVRPWAPVHLELAGTYLGSPRAVHDWVLGDHDFTERPGAAAGTDGRSVAGRVLLTGGAAQALAGAAVKAIAVAGAAGEEIAEQLLDEIGPDRPLAVALAHQDLLSGVLETLTAQLRRDPTGALVRAPDVEPGDVAPGRRPAGFTALRAGHLRLDRLRLVDGFGRYLELAPDAVRRSEGMAGPEPGLTQLVPRFTAPARVLLRYVDATGATRDASGGVSPVCGYLTPSPLDGTLAFADADGQSRGRLVPATGGALWEPEAGRSAALGTRPSTDLANPTLGVLADALFTADRAVPGPDGALASTVVLLDTTRWTVDRTGRAGTEHLSLLLGHPIVVLRAALRIEIEDPRRPPENLAVELPVRLGELTRRTDGLLAYFAHDDWSHIRAVHPALVDYVGDLPPFVDASGWFTVQPHVTVPLLLLVVPGADVHVTTGLLPRKEISMEREWTATALARLSPSLRAGPVLRDAAVSRLPVPSDIRGEWTWHRRSDPFTWAADTVIPATTDALLPDYPPQFSDGWLTVKLLPNAVYPALQQSNEIVCARRRGGRIEGLGLRNPDGVVVVLKVAEVIRLLGTGRHAFFTRDAAGRRAGLTVVQRRDGSRYLRSEQDRIEPNNLMRLPDCPS